MSYIGETLTSTQKETLKSTCLQAISGLMTRLEPREISKLNRFVVKVIETTSNPGTLYECLKLLKCFVKYNGQDKIMSAKILLKTVVLILHPCLRVRKTVNTLIEQILSNSEREEIIAFYAPILKNYTKDVSTT